MEGIRKVDLKFIDRSFTNMGYIGYGDGIDLEDLDKGGNWQFLPDSEKEELNRLNFQELSI